MAYDDQAYIDDYLAHGHFPAIHRHITELFKRHVRSEDVVFDLGACTGLLTLAMAPHCANVVGFEARESHITRARALRDRVLSTASFRQEVLTPDSTTFSDALKVFQPTIVVMRRVLPEISGGHVSTAREFIARLHDAGVRLLILEGRVDSARSTHPLRNTDQEIAVCQPDFVLVERLSNCVALERV